MAKLTLPIYDLSGAKSGDITLNESIFGYAIKPQVVHQAIVSFLANRRATTAHTKDRGEVVGSNKKPWRQKGTGNARHGSAQSPIWRGGGVTFGPRNDRNYSVRMPQKMRQAALKSALSSKLADDKLIIINALNLDGKTKSWITATTKLPVTKGVLVVDANKNDMADRAIRNVEKAKFVSLDSLTIYDIVRFSSLVMSKAAVDALTNRLTGEKV